MKSKKSNCHKNGHHKGHGWMMVLCALLMVGIPLFPGSQMFKMARFTDVPRLEQSWLKYLFQAFLGACTLSRHPFQDGQHTSHATLSRLCQGDSGQ